MNSQALSDLAANAKLWARTFVALTDALLKEGMPEERARDEARGAANFATCISYEESLEGVEPCLLCGRGGLEL